MKRFTETLKWSDPWFRRLSPVAKLLWIYLTDNCDCTGLIDLDIDLAAFHIGSKITEKHLGELSSRVDRTIDEKIFIPRFIPFQYGSLSDTCPAHKPIIKLVTLRELEINGKGYQYPKDRVAVESAYSTGKRKDKEKEKKGESEGDGLDFIQQLKALSAYQGIDVDREVGRMQAWLLTPKGKGRQLTKGFIVRWLNKVDVPMGRRVKPEKLDPSRIRVPVEFTDWAREIYPQRAGEILTWKTWDQVPEICRLEWKREKIDPLIEQAGG